MRFRTDQSSPGYEIHLLKKLRIFFRRVASLLFNLISFKLKNSFPLTMLKPKTTSGRRIVRASASESKPMLYSKSWAILGCSWSCASSSSAWWKIYPRPRPSELKQHRASERERRRALKRLRLLSAEAAVYPGSFCLSVQSSQSRKGQSWVIEPL